MDKIISKNKTELEIAEEAEKTEMEKAIDELKAGHESNAEAIQELASITAGSEV